jgi:adenine-specific DNA methylase
MKHQEKMQFTVPPSGGSFAYLKNGIHAENHTPIYKMHRYFARRPHNVFRHLIESYSQPGDIILDSFCGGGVTLVEGLATSRKVVAVDTNPLATFVSDCQTTRISIPDYEKLMDEIECKMRKMVGAFYSTQDRQNEQLVENRWIELAYKVVCQKCNKETLLSNERKFQKEDKGVNGKYSCVHCDNTITAVSAQRTGYEIVSVTYRSSLSGERVTVKPNNDDIKNLEAFEGDNFPGLIQEHDLWYPDDRIPANWDRQQEDCLHRKSIKRFSDLYTRRSLFSNAYLLKTIQDYQKNIDPELYKILLFTFSAVVRYTNNMTVSAGNWMDGRPVAWAKHAFWIPNQFVEVNPLEYIRMRRDAIVDGMRYQQGIIATSKRDNVFESLLNGKATHVIWTRSSEKLDIPDESISAVITDPPYGSNVQYGELSHYWLVWLQKDLDLKDSLFSLGSEVLVNRKSKQKNYDDYEEGMYKIYLEAFRVLKPSGVLSFTFNNKDIRSWYAVIKAAIRAGFTLEPEGVIYQDPIENYKNTAHTRFAGTVHGDFIYTFKKQGLNHSRLNEPAIVNKEGLITEITKYLSENNTATTSELYIVCIKQLIPSMVKKAISGDARYMGDLGDLDFNNLDGFLGNHLQYDEDNKRWNILAV